MKIERVSSDFNRSHYLFYRERSVDKPSVYYGVTFYNSCGEWNVEVVDPELNVLEGIFTETYKSLSLGIDDVCEKLSKLTGETK